MKIKNNTKKKPAPPPRFMALAEIKVAYDSVLAAIDSADLALHSAMGAGRPFALRAAQVTLEELRAELIAIDSMRTPARLGIKI